MKRTKDTQITFRLTDEKARRFKAFCALEKTSIQNVLERAVDEFMNQLKEKPEESF